MYRAMYWHFVIMVVGGVETMWLGHCHTRGLIKWEPIWWVAIAEMGGIVIWRYNLV